MVDLVLVAVLAFALGCYSGYERAETLILRRLKRQYDLDLQELEGRRG